MATGRVGRGVELIEDAEAQYGLALTKQPTPGFAELWSNAYASSEEGLRAAWIVGRDAWLRLKEGKSNSAHTRRSYERGSAEWIEFVTTLRQADGQPVRPWEATSEHVRLWQEQLAQRGLAPSTVNQRLAACSSWYSFMGRERVMVNGYEISPFMDRAGRFRSNPFAGANVQRLPVEPYGHARVLTGDETQRLITLLQERSHTLIGARNYALLLAYLLTGYRNMEVVGLKWGAIRPNRNQPGAWVVAWQGKGGKRQSDPLPVRVYYAIVHHLKLSGRQPETLDPDEYIFTPVVTHGLRNLSNAPSAAGHLSTTQAERILHTALRRAGVERPDEVRIHDLRHTFAHQYRRRNKDLEGLRARLHHESLATTGIYVRDALDDPVDDYSEGIFQGLLLSQSFQSP
jgi:site-specific recombinase XerD